MPPDMDIGLAGYGLYLPDGWETAEDVAAKAGLTPGEVRDLGIGRKVVPSPEDQPVPMASKAAGEALERAEGISPDDVDVVIWTGEEYKDYIAQTASIRLQEETGCRKAYAFDLVGQGVTMVLGLRVARDLMIGDDTVGTVLLAGGTRNIDLVDYENPDTRFLLAASASGAAVVLKKGLSRNRLMGMAFLVDPDMADDVYVPGGGTERPFSLETIGTKLMYFQSFRPGLLAEYLETTWPRRLAEAAAEALGGRKPDYLALRHTAPAQRRRVLDRLGIGPNRSEPLDDYGHHGPNDVVLSLDLGLKKGAVTPGSTVVLVSGGIGFHYAAATIDWGWEESVWNEGKPSTGSTWGKRTKRRSP